MCDVSFQTMLDPLSDEKLWNSKEFMSVIMLAENYCE